MSNCRSKFVSAIHFLKHFVVPGKTNIGNGSIIKFSSNTLLTEDLIRGIWFYIYLHHVLTLAI